MNKGYNKYTCQCYVLYIVVFFFKQKTAYEMSASLVGSEMCIRDSMTTRVSTAVFSAILAMEHKCVSSVEGIIDDNVDRSRP